MYLGALCVSDAIIFPTLSFLDAESSILFSYGAIKGHHFVSFVFFYKYTIYLKSILERKAKASGSNPV